ncbi:7TM diverse intracellular signaling [Leptospira inadai serovar Lyme str. 10]|uniref:7TM diverse intracellular signaling n=2 Tax=Leptospira inadai serovar Lyme TaxID=293084 RepID=V6H9R3_9LEPT|nr:7TM diverse intracellular signaling domain-containing protein [Leptospira inadai]EQA35777.1 7TM diverse intracellular signaling [Leptospira inadai serovar Lyme str. 10]PNV76928.1 histidine kinase [Leptospira inadai serovar Lyme]
MRGAWKNLGVLFTIAGAAFFFFYPSQEILSKQTIKDLVVAENMDGMSLLPYISIFKDTSGRMTFSEVREASANGLFKTLEQNSIGYTEAAIWIRLGVSNPVSSKRDWILEIDYPLLDYVDLYTSTSGNDPVNMSGDMRGFSSRQMEYRNFAYSFQESPSSRREIYFRVVTKSSVLLPLLAFTQNRFAEHVFTEQLALGFYYGSTLVMVVYNLFLFFSIRDRSYLYYVVYILSYILFQFTLNGLSFQYLWRNSTVWANFSLPFFLFLGLFTVSLFGRSFLGAAKYTPKSARIYNFLFFLQILGMVSTLTLLDYRTSIVFSLVVMFLTLGFLVFNGVQCLLAGRREARYFLLAWSVFILFSFLFGIKSFGLLPDNFFTLYGIQIGSVMEVSLLSLGLADRIKGLSDELSDRVLELDKMRVNAEESEAKYRSLFEAEEDFLFSIDQNWTVLAANRSVAKHLGYKPPEIIGKNFMELVYKSGGIQDAYKKLYVLEKLEELSSEGKPVRFLAEFLQKYLREPKELQVQFQVLEYEGQREILGRAYEPDQDLMARFVDSEKLVFSANNYLQNAELLSQRLTANLFRFTDTGTVVAIRNCLREMIINAIEHGNLNISFDEKTRAMEDGNYFRFVQERQKDPYYKGKKIKVEYSLSADRFGVRITDEGKGFNHARTLKNKMEQLNSEGMTHGRGLTLTLSTFDVVKFNSNGNQVTLVKYF